MKKSSTNLLLVLRGYVRKKGGSSQRLEHHLGEGSRIN